MKALCWHSKGDVQIDNVPEPQILDPKDIIVKVTTTAICGSDLHILNGLISHMEKGDILGHEFMGKVVEVGSDVKNLTIGDRVVVPFTISCGHCFFCDKTLYSACDKSNPGKAIAEKEMGHAPSGVFGYSHMLGGYSGGQAEYVRVPFADIGPIKIPDELDDEKVLFLSDIFPTGYMAAENCDIEKGDTVAIWGCGPVGQFAIQSAWLLGAERVIAIDEIQERLDMAKKYGRAETIDFSKEDVKERLNEMTKGRGPDKCIDAVGAESHGYSMDARLDEVKTALSLSSDRPEVLREAIFACRKAGTISIPGVYLGKLNRIPFGAAMNKGLTFKTGQTHVQRYLKPLLKLVTENKIDPSFIITHRLSLDEAPQAYEIFKDKKDSCIKVILKP